MIRPIEPPNCLSLSARHPVIDVRSPAEFLKGHIPGAVNIPLFSDPERAIVGTLYVRSGREDAIMKGLDIALPKTSRYLRSLGKVSPGPGSISVHCWRGGLRSAMMAEVFSKAGYDVGVLKGGYKAYRRYIREGLARPARIVVLGGFTGSGKTSLLQVIAAKGEQVLDLEALACHKGSVFGSFGQPVQPSNEQFENNLYARWSDLDLERTVWVEDESRMIGRVTLPDPVVEHITSGTLIRVVLDAGIRIDRLVKEYSGFDKRLLAGAIGRIADRLGGSRAKEAVASLDKDQFHSVAEIVLGYYDKAYLFSMERRKNKNIHKVLIRGDDAEADALRIMELEKNLR